MQFRHVEPACRLVFQQRELAAHHRAEKAMHGQVEGGVVVFDSAEEVAHLHVDGKFFFEFADKRLLRAFAGFHLAAREFPPVLEITVTALGREDLLGRGTCAVPDDSCHYLDTFHEGKCRKELARRRRKAVAYCAMPVCAIP